MIVAAHNEGVEEVIPFRQQLEESQRRITKLEESQQHITEEIKFSEEFDLSEDEPEPIEKNSEPSEAESQPTDTLPTPAKSIDEVNALRLRLEQGEQCIAKLERQVATMKDGKRKWEGNTGKNSGQQQGKRQKTIKTYAVGPNVKKEYMGKKPHCYNCNRHHTGPCGTPCGNCKKYGHQTKACRSNISKANVGAPRVCFECGNTGHFKRKCPQLRNQNNDNLQGKMSRNANM